MSDLYRYDVGDESDPDSWGESPKAYMRRNWLEAHNYLVKIVPDYEGVQQGYVQVWDNSRGTGDGVRTPPYKGGTTPPTHIRPCNCHHHRDDLKR